MDAEKQLEKICNQIENDPNMSDEEKSEAIREEERGFAEHQQQYEYEQEMLRRDYGF